MGSGDCCTRGSTLCIRLVSVYDRSGGPVPEKKACGALTAVQHIWKLLSSTAASPVHGLNDALECDAPTHFRQRLRSSRDEISLQFFRRVLQLWPHVGSRTNRQPSTKMILWELGAWGARWEGLCKVASVGVRFLCVAWANGQGLMGTCPRHTINSCVVWG